MCETRESLKSVIQLMTVIGKWIKTGLKCFVEIIIGDMSKEQFLLRSSKFLSRYSHRRDNWIEHSQLCWALTKVRGPTFHHLMDMFDGKDFTAFRHEVATKCVALLGRRLKPWEFELIYHPRICEGCRRFDVKKLKSCGGCGFVYICDKCHFKKNHQKWCDSLKMYSIVNSSRCDFQLNASICGQLKKKIQKNQGMKDVVSSLSGSDVDKVLVSEVLTYPLSVLNTLKAVSGGGKVEATVLFVGAELDAEVEPLDKWEFFLLHQLDELKTLNLVFLGPELKIDTQEYLGLMCSNCKKNNKNIRYKFVGGKFYHEYAKETQIKPDLICALNSGMYRDCGFGWENSWEQTIPMLLTPGNPPLLVTEYTCHELDMDLNKIRRFSEEIQYLVKPSVNPFASLKPGLNIFEENDAPVIFRNYFQVVFKL